MMLNQPFALYLLATVCSVGALLAGTALHVMWPDWRWEHEPLHSTIEAVGGLVAIAMAMVLLHTNDKGTADKYGALAAGFLGMGILEEFHAIARPGNAFVLFRNVASLAGGTGFLLAWRAHLSGGELERRWLPWRSAIAALGIGTSCLMFPQYIPEMVRNGEFTPTAVAPQSVACLLFLFAAAHFLWDYRRSSRSEDALFASLALLFGLAEFVFMYSIPWDNRWWFWHSLRLIASLLALGFIGHRYFQMTSDLQTSLAENIQAKETVSQSEGQLRQILSERERMAQDLHDSTIQSLFAIGLNLERCQRLVSTAHHEVATQLGTAVAGLKGVIRDLRGYILGLESPISNGRALEAALTSLVNDVNNSSQLHCLLHISPEAAERVTPEQAAQLLPIAREATSNSLRHADAHTISLSLQLHDGAIRLMVEDDGVGFDAATVHSHGHGLKNMQKRARAVGGRFEVKSDPGHGTRIECLLPQGRDEATI
jgi:signal transduction histidine kinase